MRQREELTDVSTLERGTRSRNDEMGRQILMPLIKPILDWLHEPDIEEVAMNRPGELWVRFRKPDKDGRLWVPFPEPELDRRRMTLVLHTLANIGNTPNFGPHGMPLCFGTLPGNHRYAGGLGWNFQYESGELSSEGTILFCARQWTRDMSIRFEDYGLEAGKELSSVSGMVSRKADASDGLTRILRSIERGDHLLVSGGMGSGKTTLLNHIIGLLSPNLRIVTVEDTSEMKIPQRNRAHIIVNRMGKTNAITYQSVVDLITRMTPDVIMAGEISTTNAPAVWELMRAGHGHFMTTIHAEHAEEALSTFATRMSHEGTETHDRERLIGEMKKKLRVIQVNRSERTGKREITQVL